MMRTRWVGGPLVAIFAALCVPAWAQDTTTPDTTAPAAAPSSSQTIPAPLPDEDSGTTKLEEVVVTSTKRAKSQRDIPGSVGAIRGEDLEKMHAQGMSDYLKLVPGVAFMDSGDPDESMPIIRGIASQIGFGLTQVPAGVYLEDMPFADLFAASSFPDLNPFDLERVEVLKGPQGTLFGSGALAGAIRYIVEKPKFSAWEAKFSETLSSTAQSSGLAQTASAAINIPIGDTLAFRVVGLFHRRPGIYDMSADNCTPALPSTAPHAVPATLQILGHQLGQLPGPVTLPVDISGTQVCDGKLRDSPDADWEHQYGGRALAAWQPTERLKVSALYFVQNTHAADFGLADDPNHLGSNDFPFASPRQHNFGGGNLLVTYDFDWARLLSSTNRMTKHDYVDTHAEWGFGLGSQNQNEYVTATLNNVRGWTQELRLSSPEGGTGLFEWLIGASYLHYFSTPNMQYTYLGPDMPDPTDPSQVSTANEATAQVFATSDQLATEKALFGEITARLSKHWEVTAGARRYQTGLHADTNLCGAQVIAFFQELCHPQTFSDLTNGLNPKASIRYIHNKNLQWYLLAAKGFQFGGIQVNPPAPGFEQSANAKGFSFGPYKSSKLWNYESGIRTEWLDHRLRFDVGFFYLDWKDLQLTVTVPYLVTNVMLSVIANVGHAHSTGIETAFEAIPFRGAKWSTSFSFMNAVTDEAFVFNGVAVPSGTRLPGSPKFQIANVFAYETALFWGWNIGPTLTHSYIGQSPDATPPTGTIGGYSTLDGRLVLAKRDSRFAPELSFGVNNIADRRGIATHSEVHNAVTGDPIELWHYIQPRTIVGNLSFKF